MRILLMIQHLWRGGGTETHVLTLARGLRTTGHDVAIYTSGGPWVEKARRSGTTVIENSGMQSLTSAAVHSFAHYVRRNRFHIIHAHDGSTINLIGRAKPLLGRIPPVIFTLHGPYVSANRLRYASNLTQAVIGVSEPMRSRAIRLGGISSRKVRTVPNGIDTEAFRPISKPSARAILGIPSQAVVVGYAGRFTVDKVVLGQRVSQALKQYAGRTPNTFVLIAGRNAERRVTSSSTTKVLGHVAHMEVFFSACDVVVGTARVAAEALACGTPTIVIGVGGYHGLVTSQNIRRMISTNFGDHAVNSRDWNEYRLEERIAWVRRHYGAVRRDTQLVRRSVVRTLSSDAMVKAVVSIYRSVR